MKRSLTAAAALAALVLGVAGVYQAGTAQERVSLADMAKDPNQWVMPSLDYANTRNSALKEITPDNAKNLTAAWSLSTGATRGHEGQPLVIGDTMYFESAYPESRFRDRPRRLPHEVGVYAEARSVRRFGRLLRPRESRRRLR